MRIQESEYRIQKKNNDMVILAPGSCILMLRCARHRAWGLVPTV